MGQLEPLEHNTHENADVDTCPACMMTTEIFNEMAAVLEKASMRLCIDDVAFIIALLLQSVSDAAPTESARLLFVSSFAKHMATLTQTRVRWLLTDEPPNHKGAVN